MLFCGIGLPPEIAEELRDAVVFNPGLTMDTSADVAFRACLNLMRTRSGVGKRFPPRGSELKRGRPAGTRNRLEPNRRRPESPIRHYARLLVQQLHEAGQTITGYDEVLREAESALTYQIEHLGMTLISAFEFIRAAQAEYVVSALAASHLLSPLSWYKDGYYLDKRLTLQ